MKVSKLLITAIAAMVSLFCACTAEEEDYPANRELVIQVGMEGTRATPENSWTTGDYIAVQVGESVKKYIITNTSGKAVGADMANTFYWDDLGETSVKVTAWSFGGKYVSSLEDSISIASDQSNYDDYKGNDFLYAKSTTVKQGETNTLNFYHQMVHLHFNIKVDDSNESVTGMTIGGEEDFEKPFKKAFFYYTDTLSNFGWFEYSEENMSTAIITPYKEETAATGYEVSYSAILIPIVVEGAVFNITTSDGTSETTYSLNSYDLKPNTQSQEFIVFEPGYKYTINLTIRNKELIIGEGKTAVTVVDWSE